MPPPIRAAAPFAIAYRPMTDEDLPFMAALYGSTRAAELAAVPWPQEAKDAFVSQQFLAQHSHYQTHYPNAEWLVIEREGEAIGRLYIEEWPTQFRLIDIALAPDCQQQGIGRAILEDAIAMARSKSKRLSIHVEKNNPAYRLYTRLGFTVAGDTGVYDLLEVA